MSTSHNICFHLKILLLKNMGFIDLSAFHFIQEPPIESLRKAEEELRLLAAIDGNGEITDIGKKVKHAVSSL